MKQVEVEALKPFGKTAQGEMVHPGDPPFMVTETRASELEANGLARRTGKAAPAPANKMAAEPANKAGVPTGNTQREPIKVTRRSSAAKLSPEG